MAKKSKAVAVVVTTAHKGVFFGMGPTDIPADKKVTLTDARMCVYWSVAVKGVLGLAGTGPAKDCRVTAAVPQIALSDVTAILVCSPEAVSAWRSGPWA